MSATSTFTSKLEKLRAHFDALEPELELTVRDAALDLTGYVVVWNTTAAIGGPLGKIGKGGTRITPTLTLQEVGMLAKTMTLKNAGAGLPLGGAKSGIRADPNGANFEKKYRRFVQLAKHILAEHGGPFGGFGFDVGGAPEHLVWGCDELGSSRSFTGKSLANGGTDYDREGIAGYGVVAAAQAYLVAHQSTLKDRTALVQGLGAMGGAVVRYLRAEGCQIHAVSDPRIGGTITAKDVPPSLWETLLDAAAALELNSVRERLLPYASGDPAQVLTQRADLLFPCALQGVITSENAPMIQASLIVEGANSPTESAAKKILCDRAIPRIPDFIANPGGIIAAYVEMTSPLSREENARTRGKTIEAKRLTQERITENVRTMVDLSNTYGITLEEAGSYLALSRIVGGSDVHL
jgi:glutamate dehydrogenase (NAD(P)+)